MQNIRANFSIIDCKLTCAGDRFGNKNRISGRSRTFLIFLFINNHSGPIEALVLGGDSAISRWRALLGPTKVFKTIYSHPDSLRGMYGLSDTRNAGHGSDSMESAKREIGIFFNDFDVDQWLSRQQSA